MEHHCLILEHDDSDLRLSFLDPEGLSRIIAFEDVAVYERFKKLGFITVTEPDGGSSARN